MGSSRSLCKPLITGWQTMSRPYTVDDGLACVRKKRKADSEENNISKVSIKMES